MSCTIHSVLQNNLPRDPQRILGYGIQNRVKLDILYVQNNEMCLIFIYPHSPIASLLWFCREERRQLRSGYSELVYYWRYLQYIRYVNCAVQYIDEDDDVVSASYEWTNQNGDAIGFTTTITHSRYCRTS